MVSDVVIVFGIAVVSAELSSYFMSLLLLLVVREGELDDEAEAGAPPESLSGGRAGSQSIGMARGIGLVDAMPSVASLIESRRILLVDIIDELELSLVFDLKAVLNVRLLLLFSLDSLVVFCLLLDLSADVFDELEVFTVWLAEGVLRFITLFTTLGGRQWMNLLSDSFFIRAESEAVALCS